MDLIWLQDLAPQIKEIISGASGDFFGGLGSTLVLRLLDAGSHQLRKRFKTPAKQQALAETLSRALVTTIQDFDDDPILIAHYLDIFDQFTARENVAGELSLLIEPTLDSELDMPLLLQEFDQLDFDREMFAFDLTDFLLRLGANFCDAAAASEDLHSLIDTQALRGILSKMVAVADATQRTAIAAEQGTVHLQSIDSTLSSLLDDSISADSLRNMMIDLMQQPFIRQVEALEKISTQLHQLGATLAFDSTGAAAINTLDLEVGATLNRYLPQLREDLTALRLAIVKHQPTDAELDLLEQRYRQHIIKWFETLTFQGVMSSARSLSIPLEEVYVDLRAVAEVPVHADAFSLEERRLLLEVDESDTDARHELLRQMDSLRRERWSRTIPERKSIVECLCDPANKAVVILGDPGSGKTTLLHLLALVYAKGHQTISNILAVNSEDTDLLPIFAPLAAYDDMRRTTPDLSLPDFLARYYEQRRGIPGLSPLFEREFRRGRVILLLDGLDEVLETNSRTFIVTQVKAHMMQWLDWGCRLAVTSRFVGYWEAPLPGDIPILSVLDFRQQEIAVFVHKWAHAYEAWLAGGTPNAESSRKALQLESDLLHDVQSNVSVQRLAANPLMLTMLALLRRQIGTLPHRRILLYEKYVSTIVENWIEFRSQGERAHTLELLDLHEAERILIPLSLWLQIEKPSGTASSIELQRELTDIYLRDIGVDPGSATPHQRNVAQDAARRFVAEMRKMTGLVVERGYDAYGFMHLTFQEYFAGRALAQLSDSERWKLIYPNRHNPRWREPLMLCIGWLGIRENRRHQVTQLVSNLLNCQDDTESDLHRNLLLALAIAADDVNLDPNLLAGLAGQFKHSVKTQVSDLAHQLTHHAATIFANTASAESYDLWLASVLADRENPSYSVILRTLSEFIKHEQIHKAFANFLHTADVTISDTVVEALGPVLADDAELRSAVVAKLQEDNYFVRNAAVRALTPSLREHAEVRMAILNVLQDPTSSMGYFAAHALSPLLRDDTELRAAVVTLLQNADSNVRKAAVTALMHLLGGDTELHTAAVTMLQDDSSSVRQAAVGALAPWLGDDTNLRAALVKLLQDDSPSVRRTTVDALAPLLSKDAELQATLVKMLQDENPSVRLTTVVVLAPLLSKDAKLRALILTLRHDTDPYVRQAVLDAIASAASDNSSLVAELQPLLHSSDHETRALAITAIAKQASEIDFSDIVAPTMQNELIICRDAHYIRELLTALATHHQFPRQHLLICMSDFDPFVRAAAVTALAPMLGGHPELRDAVAKMLQDSSSDVRQAAVTALSPLLGDDTELRKTIVIILQDPSSNVRQAAVTALSPLLGEHTNLRAAVLNMLHDSESAGRQAALNAIAPWLDGDIKLRAASLVALQDESYLVRRTAVEVLAPVLVKDLEDRAALLMMLQDSDWSVKSSTVAALAPLLAEDEDSRAAVLKMLQDSDWFVRQRSATALAPLMNDHPEVRAALVTFLERQDAMLNRKSSEALVPLLVGDTKLCAAIMQKLQDPQEFAREAAVSALAPLVRSDANIRAAALMLLQDPGWSVRQRVLEILSPLLASDAELRHAVEATLQDESENVRLTAVQELAPLLDSDADMRSTFISMLRDGDHHVRLQTATILVDFAKNHELSASEVARLAEWMQEDWAENEIRSTRKFMSDFITLRTQVATLVGSTLLEAAATAEPYKTWLEDPRMSKRTGAALILCAAPLELSADILSTLVNLPHDRRDFRSLSARLAAAAHLINHDRYSDAAIKLCLTAITYGTSHYEALPESWNVRHMAATVLGKLDALHMDKQVYTHLKAVMYQDSDDDTRNAAYGALVRLARLKDESGEKV